MAHQHLAIRGSKTRQDAILNADRHRATTFEGSPARCCKAGLQDAAVSRVPAPAQEPACLEAPAIRLSDDEVEVLAAA